MATNAGEEEEEEIAELIKGVKRHGGELSLAYRPFKYIPGAYVASASLPLLWDPRHLSTAEAYTLVLDRVPAA